MYIQAAFKHECFFFTWNKKRSKCSNIRALVVKDLIQILWVFYFYFLLLHDLPLSLSLFLFSLPLYLHLLLLSPFCAKMCYVCVCGGRYLNIIPFSKSILPSVKYEREMVWYNWNERWHFFTLFMQNHFYANLCKLSSSSSSGCSRDRSLYEVKKAHQETRMRAGKWARALDFW